MSTAKRRPWSLALALFACIAAPTAARAQGFVSPMFGYDFSGDSGCPQITGCQEKNLNISVSIGGLGRVAGSELEIAHARNFFGEIPGASSSVLTVMGNVLLAPRFAAVQPYALAGVGLIKTNVDLSAAGLLETSNNNFGWDIGGGLMVHVSEHVGLRGDIRHYHAFQSLQLLGLSLGDTKLDFGRAAGGLVFRF
jgi:hypothetical protein